MQGNPASYYMYVLCTSVQRTHSEVQTTVHFGDMKLIKNWLRFRVSDSNLGRLMHIALEGSQLPTVDFDQVLDMYKQQNLEWLCNHLLLIHVLYNDANVKKTEGHSAVL